MPELKDVFYTGKVHMSAHKFDNLGVCYAAAEFDHSCAHDRNAIRLFVNEHLSLGHVVVSTPLS
jgi:hypothetical protein